MSGVIGSSGQVIHLSPGSISRFSDIVLHMAGSAWDRAKQASIGKTGLY